MTVREIADDVLDAVVRTFDAPLEDQGPDAPPLDLDGAVIVANNHLQAGASPADAARRVLAKHRLAPEPLRRLATVGLAAILAWHAEPLEAFAANLDEMPDGLTFPVRVGEFATGPEASGFSRARWLIDTAGRRVGVVDSDEGPALVGPLGVLDVAILLEERRLRWAVVS